ncbi:MAG TPA: hypothetical protein VJ553_01815 [Candidatus Paceibacterota bacterium]|nr:hypothetical protein [Candidatus Paceibacterota bacterium]
MRRILNVLAIASAALVIGACAAKIQNTVFPVAVPADVIPVADFALPPFDEDVVDVDVISGLIEDLPDAPPPCDLMKAIVELEHRMLGTELKVGTKDFRYDEVRNGSVVHIKDPEKQIALGLVNPLTCETHTTIVVKHGDQILTHPSVQIEPRRRANGIRWNNWATEYTVTKPEGYAVVATLYPYVQGSGRSRKIIPVFYSPYSAILHTPNMVENGLSYLSGLIASASEELRRLQVPSRAFPGTLVADHELYHEVAMRLDANEHMDPGEFILDPRFTADRIHIIIGTNRDRTARYTCSSEKACGISQFTDPTYKTMRRNYPAAKLMADSLEGRRDHFNVTKAQLLLLDSDLATFIEAFGPDVATDPWVVEGLVAAYNTGAARVVNVRRIALKEKLEEWTEAKGVCSIRNKRIDCLLDETKWYILKDRYLRNEWNRPEGIARP